MRCLMKQFARVMLSCACINTVIYDTIYCIGSNHSLNCVPNNRLVWKILCCVHIVDSFYVHVLPF